jgi:hypothetical protein
MPRPEWQINARPPCPLPGFHSKLFAKCNGPGSNIRDSEEKAISSPDSVFREVDSCPQLWPDRPKIFLIAAQSRAIGPRKVEVHAEKPDFRWQFEQKPLFIDRDRASRLYFEAGGSNHSQGLPGPIDFA